MTATWSCCDTTRTYPTARAAATAGHTCPTPAATRPARRRPRAAVAGGTATGTLAQIGAA